MVLEWRLVEDGEVLFTVPIRGQADPALEEISDEVLQKLAAIYSIAANERRLRMMRALAQRGEMRFSDLLQVATNPKLVQDCLEPMAKEGMVVHEGRGTGYKPSDMGLTVAVTITTAMGRLLEMFEEEASDLE
ncbi:MAG TPA: hypothetical protein VEJ36_04505 [Nitrososphaerales archaeon]|nr:hypothetical protein [Nitrososphaerales archaeon]